MALPGFFFSVRYMSTMDRTPIRTKFVNRLIRINDQLCFAAMGRFEFRSTLRALVAASPDAFTTSALPANPYAARLYRKMKDMADFAERSEQVELEMGVIGGVEHALAYVEEIETFRASVSADPADVIKAETPEDGLYETMSRWMGVRPERGPYRTLGYFRLLRNHYAHVNDEPTPAFSHYVAKHAHKLQRFWDNGITDLGGLTFRALPNDALTPQHAFAAMTLLRVSIEMIDRDFAGRLTPSDILEPTIAEVYAAVAPHDRTVMRLPSKVRYALRERYGGAFELPAVRAGVAAYLAARRPGT